jgi:hypothetical protein
MYYICYGVPPKIVNIFGWPPVNKRLRNSGLDSIPDGLYEVDLYPVLLVTDGGICSFNHLKHSVLKNPEIPPLNEFLGFLRFSD